MDANKILLSSLIFLFLSTGNISNLQESVDVSYEILNGMLNLYSLRNSIFRLQNSTELFCEENENYLLSKIGRLYHSENSLEKPYETDINFESKNIIKTTFNNHEMSDLENTGDESNTLSTQNIKKTVTRFADGLKAFSGSSILSNFQSDSHISVLRINRPSIQREKLYFFYRNYFETLNDMPHIKSSITKQTYSKKNNGNISLNYDQEKTLPTTNNLLSTASNSFHHFSASEPPRVNNFHNNPLFLNPIDDDVDLENDVLATNGLLATAVVLTDNIFTELPTVLVTPSTLILEGSFSTSTASVFSASTNLFSSSTSYHESSSMVATPLMCMSDSSEYSNSATDSSEHSNSASDNSEYSNSDSSQCSNSASDSSEYPNSDSSYEVNTISDSQSFLSNSYTHKSSPLDISNFEHSEIIYSFSSTFENSLSSSDFFSTYNFSGDSDSS